MSLGTVSAYEVSAYGRRFGQMVRGDCVVFLDKILLALLMIINVFAKKTNSLNSQTKSGIICPRIKGHTT